jgi:hypothetical protein
MTTRSEVELLLDRYLGDGPERVPDRVIDAALDTIDDTKQRRAFRAPWRVQEMPTFFKLALAGAAVLVVLAVGLTYLNPKPTGSVGGQSAATPSPATSTPTSPTPSPSPRALTDTSWWVPYRSVRYGYTVRHPSTWEVEPGSRDWKMQPDRTDWLTPAADRFIDRDADFQIGVSAWVVDVPAGTSSAQWMRSYYKDAQAGCGIAAAVVQDVTVGGQPGKLYIEDACADAQAFVFRDGSVTVFAVWRENQADLLEAFLSTVEFN